MRKTILNHEYYMLMCVCVYVDGCLSQCRLQLEQVYWDCNASVDDSLARALRSLCVLSASQNLFASYCAAPLLMRYLFDPVRGCFLESVGILKSFSKALLEFF